MTDTYRWYSQLKKPFFAPPSWLFGPVWTVLYLIIFVTFSYVVYLTFKRVVPFSVLVPFLLNLIFNICFTPIQFVLRNNELALLDVALTVITLVWALYSVYPYAPIVALLNIPYLLWGTFATVLQASITYLNR